MILGILSALKTCTGFFISFGIVLGFVVIFSPTVLKVVQKTSRKRIVSLFMINLCISVILSILAFYVYALYTKYSYENLNLYLLFTLVFSVNLDLSLVVNIRRGVSRAKKSMGLDEAVGEGIKENSKKVIDIIIYFLLFILPIPLLVNREIGSFIVVLFISFLVCAFTSAFAPRLICKISERIFK